MPQVKDESGSKHAISNQLVKNFEVNILDMSTFYYSLKSKKLTVKLSGLMCDFSPLQTSLFSSLQAPS